jgi:hypothetical protein
VLGATARLQQRREISAGSDLRNRQLDRADAGVPGPRAKPVAICRPIRRPLVTLGANQTGHLRFHQRLREHANTFAQDIAVLLLE